MDLLWNSSRLGTAVRVGDHYERKPEVRKKSGARKLTEAEDNARGRAIRRRANRRARRAGKPHAAR